MRLWIEHGDRDGGGCVLRVDESEEVFDKIAQLEPFFDPKDKGIPAARFGFEMGEGVKYPIAIALKCIDSKGL